MISIIDEHAPNQVVDVAIFIKTYSVDFKNLKRLLKSLAQYNQDELPIYVCVPNEDVDLLKSFGDICDLTVVPESFFNVDLPNEKIHGRTLGYLRQQIIKLSVHKIQAAHHYVILDSDVVMIRPFVTSDFLNESGVGYTVLIEDRELFSLPSYRIYADRRRKFQIDIAQRIGLTTRHLRTSHGNVTFSSSVLEHFEQWRATEALTSTDLMEIGPYEFSWYNFYIQAKMSDHVIQSEQYIRTVHVKNEYRSLRYQGVTLKDLSRSYAGICLNSNWTRGHDDRFLKKLTRTSISYKTLQGRDLFQRVSSSVINRLFK